MNNAGFIHLVRHPAMVAKSEWLREKLIRKLHLPFVDYISDSGERVFRWALTGKEKIFQHYAGYTLSRFQFYLLQWIIQHLPDTSKKMLNNEAYTKCSDWEAFRQNF